MATKSEQQSLRLAFFDETQESFIIFDKDLFIVDVNEALLRTVRLKREQILGRHISEISPGIMESKRYQIYKEVMRTGVPAIIDELRTHPSLGNYTARVNVFQIGDGLGIAVQDISDLKDANEELETFIYKSSHDMRNPILSIMGLADLINRIKDDPLATATYSMMLKSQAEKLDNILTKLIETTRIRKDEKIIHLIDFSQIIEEAKMYLNEQKGFKEIRVSADIQADKKFFSDKRLLVLLFQNLLDNAFKYQNEGLDDPYIDIHVLDDENGVRITIADNGIGIPDHLQGDVFKMFFRANNKKSGAGLGLYTVNHTIKKLNGTISLKSMERIGTTFTLYIPSEQVVAFN